MKFQIEKADIFPYWVVNFPQDWTQWIRESPAVPHSWRKLFSFLKLCYYACVIDTPINIKHIAPHNGFDAILNSHLNNCMFSFTIRVLCLILPTFRAQFFFFDKKKFLAWNFHKSKMKKKKAFISFLFQLTVKLGSVFIKQMTNCLYNIFPYKDKKCVKSQHVELGIHSLEETKKIT